MSASFYIDKILPANSYSQVFEDLSRWKEEYKIIVKEIHPDVCNDERCSAAILKLNKFKEQLENGIDFTDGILNGKYFIKYCVYSADRKLLSLNRSNYLKLVSLKDESSRHFQKYLPEILDTERGNEYYLQYPTRAIPISAYQNAELRHVNWILSRLLEFSCWINQNHLCHAGINPDSIFIVPENHGIICTSFFHLTELDMKLKTVTGKYIHFYPSTVTIDKMASSTIDTTLSKKTAIYLLGDCSGNGAKLRGTLPEEYLDFLQRIDYNPLECYQTFRNILSKHFNTKEFHELKI